MKLSRTVSYALQAAIQLAHARSDGPVPCSHLAAEGKMPERFLLQILRNLVAHGILESTRGVDGGYLLGRPADQVSLLDIIEAIDGPLAAQLPLGENLSPGARERIEQVLQEVTGQAREKLAAVRLSDLFPAAADAGFQTSRVATPS
ncbi:MAG: Rrf2 family transcriptional regulator [Thermoguttaceae bacterium]|nr:Rrf2 family transcriptional regulator [Thermoguttaceae bacterium]